MSIPNALYVPLPTGNGGRHYGVKSVRHYTAERVTLRVTASDRELIQRAAQVLEMTEAQYMRETATNVAKALFKQIEDHAHDDDDGIRSG